MYVYINEILYIILIYNFKGRVVVLSHTEYAARIEPSCFLCHLTALSCIPLESKQHLWRTELSRMKKGEAAVLGTLEPHYVPR